MILRSGEGPAKARLTKLPPVAGADGAANMPPAPHPVNPAKRMPEAIALKP
jgi:hypothetical protein